MTSMLTPPSVPPLRPEDRARLRRRIVHGAAGAQPRRRWVPAVAAAATVAAVAAVAVVPRLGDADTTTTSPTTSPTISSAASSGVSKPASSGTTGAQPAVVPVDRGPATAAQIAAALRVCRYPTSSRLEAVWSRRVVSYVGGRPRVITALITKSTPGQPGGYYDLGLSGCFQFAMASIRDTEWRVRVDPRHPVHDLSGMGSGATPGRYQFSMFYRVDPSVVRIESRYAWRGGAGPWYRGVVVDGLAYAAAYAAVPAGGGEPDLQTRAFDAGGHEVKGS